MTPFAFENCSKFSIVTPEPISTGISVTPLTSEILEKLKFTIKGVMKGGIIVLKVDQWIDD